MTATYFYARGGKKHGPISAENVRQLVGSGFLTPTDMVLISGLGKWQPLGSISEFSEIVSPIPVAVVVADERPAASSWFYASNGERLGPFRFAQIQEMAGSGALTPQDMLLVPDRGAWVSAGDVEELHFKPLGKPGTRPSAPVGDAGSCEGDQNYAATRKQLWSQLRELARWHRWMNLCIVGAILSGLLLGAAKPLTQSTWLEGAAMFATMAVLGLLVAIVVYRLAECLELNPWFAVVVAFVPYLSILMVVELDRRARKKLRLAGINAGFAGRTLTVEPPGWFLIPEAPPRKRTLVQHWINRSGTVSFASFVFALLVFVIVLNVEAQRPPVESPWLTVATFVIWAFLGFGVLSFIAFLFGRKD